MTNKQTVHFDIDYYGFTTMTDLAIEVEFTPDEIALMRKLVSKLDKSLYNEGLLLVLQDAAPDLYNRIEVAARSEIFDHLVIEAFQNNKIEFNDRELQQNFESDVKSGRFKFEPDDFMVFSENLDPEELKAREFDTWYEEEMNKGLEFLRTRYPIDDQVEIPTELIYICRIPIDFLGAVQFFRGCSPCDNYPNIVHRRYIKKGTSATPCTCALKPFIFEFSDSADAFECLSLK